jgi:hypothetical protein
MNGGTSMVDGLMLSKMATSNTLHDHFSPFVTHTSCCMSRIC